VSPTQQAHEAHGDDHGHHGSRFIAHHYDDAQHQFDSGKLGIWLFLAQEVLFFSALFVAYVLYRSHHPEIYSYAHKWLQVKFGAINTAVLIFSSLTAAWAVRAAQLAQPKRLILCLATTILCACAFLGIKYIEYSHKYHESILFGRYFDPCVSPGGVDLLTKKNECKGVKSTIDWDAKAEKAKSGCFNVDKIDQDPHEPGLQADCTVIESVGATKRTIGDKCAEETIDETEGSPPIAKKFPCWRPAYQPAVCPDLVDGPGDQTEGTRREMGYASHHQVGVMVEYGDEEERGDDVKIAATCTDAPKPAAVAAAAAHDADKAKVLGQKAIAPIHHMTTHEEHELESMGPPPEHTSMFFTIYFAMTGLHGIHVLFGIGVFTWLLIRALKGHFTPDYFGPVDYAALYWHIVDLIWIFLFPLLYLIH